MGNKTWVERFFFLPLCDSTHFGGNTAMKTQVFFSGALSGIAEGWLESYVLYLAWPEWKGLKFYSPLWFHPFGWKHRGIAGDHRVNIIKLQVMFEWSLKWNCGDGGGGANKSAHWDGWEIENLLELYCSHGWYQIEGLDEYFINKCLNFGLTHLQSWHHPYWGHIFQSPNIAIFGIQIRGLYENFYFTWHKWAILISNHSICIWPSL